MKKIINGIEIELTQEEILLKQQQDAEELAKRQAEEEKARADKAAREFKEAEMQANKQSALNKLKALGLNDAEINAILGL